MIKLSQIIDANLKSAIKTIMSNISSGSQSQDYDILNAAIEEGKKDVANYLLGHNCAVNVDAKSHENTPLHNAVKLGDVALIDKLLMRGALVTIVNDDVNSPLHLAFLLNHTEIVDRILVNIQQTTSYQDVSNKHGLTHLHIACARGNAQVAHDFEYTGADPTCVVNKESPVYPGYTSLRFACESKSIETIEVVVRAIDPPASCINNGPREQLYALKRMQDLGRTLIKMHHQDYQLLKTLQLSKFQKACFNGCVSEVKNFLEKGTNVNTLMSQDASSCPLYTPLHFAMEADKNRQELVELLLANGADVTLSSGFGMTPIHLALYNDRKLSTSRGKNFENDDVVGVLYAAVKDKDANPMDMFGLTYFHVAVALNDMKMVKNFFKKSQGNFKPILPNCRNFAKYTPLHFAVQYGHADMAKLFIGHGADVNANENESQFDTPLQVAIQYGQHKMVDFLLRNSANAKVVTYGNKLTTLHLLAERFGYYEDEKLGLLGLVKTLVKHGVDINAKDEKLNTALHKACSAFDEKSDLVYELLNWGADINLKNWRLKTAFDIANYSAKKLKYGDFLRLYDHVQKLKDLGLKVDPKNGRFCKMITEKKEEWKMSEDWLLIEKICSDEVLAANQKERLDEIERLKVDMIDEKMSLHDFLKMDMDKAASYVQTDKIKNLISSNNCTSEYQNYGYLIEVKYNRIIQWLAAQQSNDQNRVKTQVETAVIMRPLLQQKNSVISNTSQQKIPPNATLSDVVSLGNTQRVKEMLAKGASIKTVDSKKNSLLHLAFISNHQEIVDLLLSHMKDKSIWTNMKNNHGLTHLHIAAARGNKFAVQKLLEVKANPSDFVNDDSPVYPGYTALQFACDAKSLSVVKLLSSVLNLFSNVSSDDLWDEMIDILCNTSMNPGNDRLSPFHNACFKGSSKQVEMFLENGEDVNATAGRNSKFYPLYTPLHFAIESDHDRQNKVELLLKRGADVGRRNGSYMTPLHLLFYVDRIKDMFDKYECKEDETLSVLYEAVRNKQINFMDACGLTYFHIAAALNDWMSVKRMLFQGEDINTAVLPNARGFSKYTPLHFAVEYGQTSMAKLLIQRGANVNANEDDLRFYTPLQTAIVSGQSRLVEVILENGANAKVIQPNGNNTIIHLLTKEITETRLSGFMGLFGGDDKVELIERFVKLGVDIDAKNSDGLTALHTACFMMCEHYGLVKWLLINGADINIKDKKGDTALNFAIRGKFRRNYRDFAKLYQHVQKLKDFGLPIDPKNEKFCEFIMERKDDWIKREGEDNKECWVEKMFSQETLMKKRQDRLTEIERMKEDMISDDVSLYDYLRMSPEQAAVYAKNKRIQYIVEDDEPRVLYEIYGYLIPVLYRKSLKSQGNARKKSGKKGKRKY